MMPIRPSKRRHGSRLAQFILCLASAGNIACGNSTPYTLATPGFPGVIPTASASGAGQSAVVSTAFAAPFRVMVVKDGAGVAGTEVHWTITGGGQVDSLTITDTLGIATARATAGPTAGTVGITASIGYPRGFFSTTLNAVATATAAVTRTSGSVQLDGSPNKNKAPQNR